MILKNHNRVGVDMHNISITIENNKLGRVANCCFRNANMISNFRTVVILTSYQIEFAIYTSLQD